MDLGDWLRSLGLGQYEAAFRENEIDDAVLPSLTAEDLKDLGVSIVGHRRKLLDAIAALRADASLKAPPSEHLPSIGRSAKDAAERRQLTVMFCDLVGSTALSARLDLEDTREIIGAYHRCCAEQITKAGGFVAKYMGDGVLAYFGYPQAHEDDAERAVRGALALIEAVPTIRTGQDVALQVRVGVATGVVVVGDLIGEGAAQEQGVVGETPNLAARLQALADPAQVVIAQSTRRITGGLFEYRDLGRVTLKGLAERTQAWQVIGGSTLESRFDAQHGAALTPLVGREEELELLLRRWQRAKAGEGSVLLVSGEPGIGKSRIVEALFERLGTEPYTRLRLFCSPHHQDAALYPTITQLERAAGFRRDDTDEQRLDKLEALLARATNDLNEAAPLLAQLLSVPTEGRYPALDLSPQKRKERTFKALIAQVAGLAARQPAVMVCEDVHWIDPTSLELLDLIVDQVQSLPMLLIITFRPEFTPSWVGRPQVMLLSLSRLPHRQAAEMLLRLTGGKPLPTEVADQIVDRTDGVPLFIEELTKAVVESGELADAGDHYTVRRSRPVVAIPMTLHASLLARLDRLAPVREVAQLGAALGRQFSHELISVVAPMSQGQLDDALVQLVSAELIFRRGRPPNAEYTFKHALVRDAAYSTMLRGPRQHLHARIALALEERFPETAETQPELLAHHFTEAGRAERALSWWRRAGERARERSANLEAVRHLGKALDLLGSLPETPARLDEELALRMAIAVPLIATKGYASPEVETAYQAARDLCRRLGRPPADLFRALRGLWNCYAVRGELQRARNLAEELARLAEAQEQPLWRALSGRALGTSFYFSGRLLAARQHLEDSIRCADAVAGTATEGLALFGEHPGIVSRVQLGRALWYLGFPDHGLARAEEGLALARQLSHVHMLAFALGLTAVVRLLRREHEAGLRRAEEAIAVATEQGLPQWHAIGLIGRGFARAGLGQSADGIVDLRAGVAEFNETGAKMGNSEWLGFLAAAHAAAGQVDEALATLDQAEERVISAGERFAEAELRRLRGEFVARGDVAAADCGEQWLRDALQCAREQGAKLPELRASTSLARLWRDQGKRAEARDLLAPIYGWFTEGFDTLDLKEAKALFDELAS